MLHNLFADHPHCTVVASGRFTLGTGKTCKNYNKAKIEISIPLPRAARSVVIFCFANETANLPHPISGWSGGCCLGKNFVVFPPESLQPEHRNQCDPWETLMVPLPHNAVVVSDKQCRHARLFRFVCVFSGCTTFANSVNDSIWPRFAGVAWNCVFGLFERRSSCFQIGWNLSSITDFKLK